MVPAVCGMIPLLCAAEEKTPNIVLILVDDYGWKDCGFMGSDLYETRNIDRLASESMVFSQGYSACSVSSPSRASIMTGLYTPRHGVTNWIGEPSGEAWRTRGRFSKMLPAGYRRELGEEFTTIAEVLKKEGYATFMAGKWHLGTRTTPDKQGFDECVGYDECGKRGYFPPYNLIGLEDAEPGEELDERLGKETAKFIESQVKEGKPFFAYLPFYAVHAQIQCSESDWKKYRDKIVRLEIGKDEPGFKVDRKQPVRLHQDNPVYAGLIEHMDKGVGIVLDKIRELGIDDNTVILFTGDNGGSVSGDNYQTCNLPLRGGKGRQWEGGIRVPFVIHLPGMVSSKICTTPVCGIDFFPTIAELAGVKDIESYNVDGTSLVPLLKGEEIEERPLFWHYPHYGNQGGEPSSIIRKGDWKLIHYHESGNDELYNLAEDLGETTDLASEYPDKAAEMREELDRWLKDTGALFPVPDPEYSAEKEAGYLQGKNNRLMKSLEQERKAMLSEGWQPDETWWNSRKTID